MDGMGGKYTLVLILVFTVSLAANSSLLAPYYFAGDDYFQFDKSIADWFATRGIWRIVGIPLPGWLVSQDVYAFAVIAAHAIGGYFFFLVARRGFGSVAYALFLTIIVMAFPWGYEALVWASSVAYVSPAFPTSTIRRIANRSRATSPKIARPGPYLVRANDPAPRQHRYVARIVPLDRHRVGRACKGKNCG